MSVALDTSLWEPAEMFISIVHVDHSPGALGVAVAYVLSFRRTSTDLTLPPPSEEVPSTTTVPTGTSALAAGLVILIWGAVVSGDGNGSGCGTGPDDPLLVALSALTRPKPKVLSLLDEPTPWAVLCSADLTPALVVATPLDHTSAATPHVSGVAIDVPLYSE